MTTIGMSAVLGSVLTRRVSSAPSSSGIIRSVRIRIGRTVRAQVSASSAPAIGIACTPKRWRSPVAISRLHARVVVDDEHDLVVSSLHRCLWPARPAVGVSLAPPRSPSTPPACWRQPRLTRGG